MTASEERPRTSPIRAVWRFIARDAFWWISPIVLLFVLVAAFLVLVEGSTLAPLVYSMF